jgi:hypothetical protein
MRSRSWREGWQRESGQAVTVTEVKCYDLVVSHVTTMFGA